MAPEVFVNPNESLLLTIKQISEEAEKKIQAGASDILQKFLDDCDYDLIGYIDTLSELFHVWIRDIESAQEDSDRALKSFHVQYLQSLLIGLLNNKRFALDDMHFGINQLILGEDPFLISRQ